MKSTGTIKVDATGVIEITSPAGVTLKCGGSFVNVGPSGVAIKGPMVLINSGGAAGSSDSGGKWAVQVLRDGRANRDGLCSQRNGFY